MNTTANMHTYKLSPPNTA